MSNHTPTYQELENLTNKLKQNEDRFSLLLKASEDMVTIHKPNGEYIYYNGPTCYAIQSEDIVGKMPKDLFNSEVSNTIMNTFNKVKTTGKSETIEVLLDWLGEKKWFSEYIYPITNTNGEVIELVKVCRDINKRKVAEQEIENQNKALIESKKELDLQNEKLYQLNNTLNQAQKLSHVGSWHWNMATDTAEWSDEMYNIYGVTKDNFYPSNENVAKTIFPEDFYKIEQGIEALMNGQTFTPFDFRIKRPSGEIRVLYILALERKTQSSIFGVTKDITERKQFEEIQIKNQRLKAIGEMSSSIAHDFNNSLQQMMGHLEIIKNQNELPLPSAERLNSIKSIINNVADRVSALQNFGDTVHDNKNTKRIDFNALIQDSLNESRPLWKDSVEKNGFSVIVTTDFDPIPKISCVTGELKSAIYNLIKNSVEAMPKGGKLSIKTGTVNDSVFATFTDTGIGMSEETKLKIFQPFYSTKGFKLGRGLGMSGVYSTIKKHKGDITIKYSELNKGTTIEMVFPIPESTNKKAVENVKKVLPKSKEHFDILWVDDDTMITESAAELVELVGHKCSISNSGKDALDYLNENTCDIVFTDIGMPEMNGWELADAIRSKFGDKIKIAIVSGWAVEDKLKEEHKIDFVLQKPFTFKALEEIFSA